MGLGEAKGTMGGWLQYVMCMYKSAKMRPIHLCNQYVPIKNEGVYSFYRWEQYSSVRQLAQSAKLYSGRANDSYIYSHTHLDGWKSRIVKAQYLTSGYYNKNTIVWVAIEIYRDLFLTNQEARSVRSGACRYRSWRGSLPGFQSSCCTLWYGGKRKL